MTEKLAEVKQVVEKMFDIGDKVKVISDAKSGSRPICKGYIGFISGISEDQDLRYKMRVGIQEWFWRASDLELVEHAASLPLVHKGGFVKIFTGGKSAMRTVQAVKTMVMVDGQWRDLTPEMIVSAEEAAAFQKEETDKKVKALLDAVKENTAQLLALLNKTN